MIGLLLILVILGSAALYLFLWHKFVWVQKVGFKDFSIVVTKNKAIQIILATILISLLFYLDFLRDYVFHNLTYRMNYVDVIAQGGDIDKYKDPTDSFMLKILNGYDAYDIYYIKFISTLIFIFFYAFLSHLIMKIVYPKHYILPFTSLFYGLGWFAMAFIYSGFFLPFSHDIKYNFYLIAMEIGHFLESSLPALFLLLSFKIYLSSQTHSRIE